MSLAEIYHGLRRNWQRWSFWRSHFNRQVAGRYQRMQHEIDGVQVMDEDWDNLIILDACRYDTFKSAFPETDLSGELHKAHSKGSHSREFIEKNYIGGSFLDTVYVSANPFTKLMLDDEFYALDNVWVDGWDNETGTVLPETMRDRTFKMAEEFPDKRLISHFMQPHNPFIGETRIETSGTRLLREKALGNQKTDIEESAVWGLLERGEISSSDVKKAYADCLTRALMPVEKLVYELPGKTVITADHGNVFGEPVHPFPTKVYGHEYGVRSAGLIDVPWFVCEYDERKSTVSATSGKSEQLDLDDKEVEERLESLGYI